MRRSLTLALAALLLSTVAFAGSEPHSYLVGTRHPARQSLQRMLRDDANLAGRNIEPLDIVPAYRADLTDDEAMALRKSPEVAYVEADIVYHAMEVPGRAVSTELRNAIGQTTPYGVKMVNAPSVWPVSKGAGINVAILDTGIDVLHPDLQAAYAGGFNTYAGETAQPIDDEGHGTHVSGTVAATDNNLGVVGVAPGVKLWMVRVMKSDGNGSATGPISNISQGVQWVVQQKAALGGNWIISMSLGSCTPSQTLGNAIFAAINNGVLVVAAAGNHDPSSADVCSTGNDNSYHVSYPAAWPGVIAVAAVDASSTVADFSNFGPEVAISAPGVSVLSTVPQGTGTIASVATSSSTLTASALNGSPFGTVTDMFVDCGLGSTAAAFPAAVSGHIALIKRGDSTFATKVKNAQAAGATSVIIYNKDASDVGGFTLTADPADAGHVWPLTVAVSLADGQGLLAHPGTVTISNVKDDYASFSGTSMATPHVAAVAALVWSVAPGATASAVKAALLATAHDLGDPGVDNNYGNGLVDAFAAAKQLNASAFGNGAQPTPQPVVGRMPGRRGH